MEKLEYLRLLIDLKKASINDPNVESRIIDTCNSIESELMIKRGVAHE